MDTDYDLIRRIETTTANVNDSQLDYQRREMLFTGIEGIWERRTRDNNATMKRGARGHLMGIRDEMRNLRINKKRSKEGRRYAVIKTIFHAG